MGAMQETVKQIGRRLAAPLYRAFDRLPRHECRQLYPLWAGGFHNYRKRCPHCGGTTFWVGEEFDVRVRVEGERTVVENVFRDEVHTVLCDGCGESLALPGFGGGDDDE